MTRCGVVVTVLSLLLPLVCAKGQETHGIKKDVTVVQGDLDKWRSTLKNVNLEALPISYQDGKLLDESRSLCLTHIEILKKLAPFVKTEEKLSNEVQFILNLDSLASDAMAFSTLLASLVTPSGKSLDSSTRWANQAMSVGSEASGISLQLSKQVLQRLDEADERLAKCNCLSPKQ